MKKLPALLTAAMLLGAAVQASALGSFGLNFDSQATGSRADLFAPIGFTIDYGQFVDKLDSDGDPTGQKQWIPDTGTVPASDPTLNGYGSAPSGTNALNAIDGSILFTFAQPFNLTQFSTTLDNSTFGDPSLQSVTFYDLNDTEIASYSIDQTVPGLQFSTTSPLAGVSKIVLPGSAFYDDLSIQGATAVPEPSTYGLFAIALAAAFVTGRKLKRSTV